MNRRSILVAAAAIVTTTRNAFAHHGWSSFDEKKPLYLQGKVTRSKWQNPHAELELANTGASMPADLAARRVPPQSAPIDAAQVLAAARPPTRAARAWTIELAPLTRMQAWGVREIKAGDEIEVVGYTFAGDKGEPILRVEFLFAGGNAYGLRSSPRT